MTVYLLDPYIDSKAQKTIWKMKFPHLSSYIAIIATLDLHLHFKLDTIISSTLVHRYFDGFLIHDLFATSKIHIYRYAVSIYSDYFRLKSSVENFCITGCSEINQNELINYDIGIYLGNLHQVIVDSLQNLFHF